MTDQHDVIVVGAGPAGSATAYFLATQGVDVLLVDKSDFPRDKTCGDALMPRALHVLDQMGLLDDLRATAQKADTLRFFAPNGNLLETSVPAAGGLPSYVLVVPRLRLDVAIQQRAVQAGAKFQGQSKVVDIVREAGHAMCVRLKHAGKLYELHARGVVISTGAATRLLRAVGLLPERPGLMVAARAYFENVAGIAQQLEFYFNHISLPGYGWMFPTSPTTANVGVGYLGKQHPSLRVGFKKFVAEHPRMRQILAEADKIGPVRNHPLRVDFHRSPKVRPGVVAVGEAIGLVNPFTGEGIDYALESGQIAAEVIAEVLLTGQPWTPAALRKYVRRVNERFHRLFVLLTWARRLYFNQPVLNRILGRGSGNHRVIETLINVGLSNARPAFLFSPRVLWAIARPHHGLFQSSH
ncbi:MAG: geranylgeranyl reductase family protein [Anaerolineales bacterium]